MTAARLPRAAPREPHWFGTPRNEYDGPLYSMLTRCSIGDLERLKKAMLRGSRPVQ